MESVTILYGVTSIGDQAFAGCSSLDSITFEGTKAQWNEVEKSGGWQTHVSVTVAHCSDGDVEI